MPKSSEPHAEHAVWTWVALMCGVGVWAGQQSLVNWIWPFFVANATSVGRVELWGSDVALRLPQLALRNSGVHYNMHP